MTNELRPFLKDLPETVPPQIGDLFCCDWWHNGSILVGIITRKSDSFGDRFKFVADDDDEQTNGAGEIRNGVYYTDAGHTSLTKERNVHNLTNLARQKLLPPEMTVILSEIVRELSTL